MEIAPPSSNQGTEGLDPPSRTAVHPVLFAPRSRTVSAPPWWVHIYVNLKVPTSLHVHVAGSTHAYAGALASVCPEDRLGGGRGALCPPCEEGAERRLQTHGRLARQAPAPGAGEGLGREGGGSRGAPWPPTWADW